MEPNRVTMAGELEVDIRDEEKHRQELWAFSDSSNVRILKEEPHASAESR